MSKYIYNLISFPTIFIEAMEMHQRYNNEKDIKLKEEFDNNPEIKNAYLMGGVYRGSFTDLDVLIEKIEGEDTPYNICEGWYNYLLIEKHHINAIDGLTWDDDTEIWYKSTYDKETEEFQYIRIDRPLCLLGTMGFM